jgi:hypothetical protein
VSSARAKQGVDLPNRDVVPQREFRHAQPRVREVILHVFEDLPDRGRRDPDTEPGQLAVDPTTTPGRIPKRQPHNQLPHPAVSRKTSRRSRRDRRDHRRRSKTRCQLSTVPGATINRNCDTALGHHTDQQGKPRSVAPGQPTLKLTPQEPTPGNSQPVAKNEYLDVPARLNTPGQPHPGQQLPHHNTDQPQRHKR